MSWAASSSLIATTFVEEELPLAPFLLRAEAKGDGGTTTFSIFLNSLKHVSALRDRGTS